MFVMTVCMEVDGNFYLSRLDIKINIFSNVCMIDHAISLFILFPD